MVKYSILNINNDKKWQKDVGLIVLAGLKPSSHSRSLSHYCTPRGLLAAEFPPWPGSPLLSQPGHPGLPQCAHVDGELSADVQSTTPRLKPSTTPDLQVAGLQERATTPSRETSAMYATSPLLNTNPHSDQELHVKAPPIIHAFATRALLSLNREHPMPIYNIHS
ncbi:Microspherule protein 1 [Homalodisca vitripennis]|nr:Microspherule protein 1 [Homalodisca vitripennis]